MKPNETKLQNEFALEKIKKKKEKEKKKNNWGKGR